MEEKIQNIIDTIPNANQKYLQIEDDSNKKIKEILIDYLNAFKKTLDNGVFTTFPYRVVVNRRPASIPESRAREIFIEIMSRKGYREINDAKDSCHLITFEIVQSDIARIKNQNKSKLFTVTVS